MAGDQVSSSPPNVKMNQSDLLDFSAVTFVSILVLFIILITNATFGITLLGILIFGIIHGSFFYVKMVPPTEGFCLSISNWWKRVKEVLVSKFSSL
jgi:hypothetical protein